MHIRHNRYYRNYNFSEPGFWANPSANRMTEQSKLELKRRQQGPFGSNESGVPYVPRRFSHTKKCRWTRLMSSARSDPRQYCTLERYVHVWMVGTGLRISLAPGRYRITAEEQIDGKRYLQLENIYRIEEAEYLD